MTKTGSDFNRIIETVAARVADDKISSESRKRFHPDDVVLGWITAVRQYVGDGKINNNVAKQLQERAAELTAAYSYERDKLQRKGVDFDEVN